MDKKNNPLKVALHAMDDRSRKVMGIYLQESCYGIAEVVNDDDSDVDIFDADTVNAGRLLDEYRAKNPHKPVMLLSLKHENVIRVRKPIKTKDMLAGLEKARTLIHPNTHSNGTDNVSGSDKKAVMAARSAPIVTALKPSTTEVKKQKKPATALQINAEGFDAFVGNVPNIDVNDPSQFSIATYNPKEYFQSYIESAYKVCEETGQIRQLNSDWSPLLIFPLSNEVWLDADEKQLRAFAGLKLTNALNMKLSIASPDTDSPSLARGLKNSHQMDAFLWKLACWASKGRYPETLDINRPVYLKSWPNFTCLLATPHALRISALLIRGPRTLPNIAKVLNIKPQYVFVFISAACALNLAGQARRQVDELIEPPGIEANKSQGLMSRIISQLRGNKA